MKKPSVTELLKLLDKPALLYWANKIGLQGIKLNEYRKKSLSSGVSLHKQIEDYIKKGVIPENKILKVKLPLFLKDKEVLEIEKDIETDLFKGRCDFVFKLNGSVYVCDFKSNQSAIYIENRLQLISYSMGINCDSFCIVSIPDMTILEVNISNREPYIEIIKSLHSIYVNKLLLDV